MTITPDATLQNDVKNDTLAVMTTLSSKPYKGTRDYYPEDKRVQNYIFDTWRRVVEQFGYEEYGAPMLEPLEVYTAKSGQELASEQTYAFTDRGDRVVAIRPEMTPSVSRMIADRQQSLASPARFYSIANFMRYERPQRGREREFWQLNTDIFGSDGVQAEAEIISMADAIIKAFGATDDDFVIRLNNRKLINYMMAQYLELDITQAQQMIKLFDRKNKISAEDFSSQLRVIAAERADEVEEKVAGLLSATNMADLPVELRDTEAVREVQELFTMLDQAEVTSAVFDITLMRGLDYYTGTVFEAFDAHPENNRSMFGGGRYDGLVGLFGAKPMSAVGMAPGGTMFEHFLSVHGLIPELGSKTDLYLAVLEGAEQGAGRLARELRGAGIRVEHDISGRKLDKQIKTADKKQIQYVVVVGAKELASGSYNLRDIRSGEVTAYRVAELIAHFTQQA